MPVIFFLFNIVMQAWYFGGESPGICAAYQNLSSTFFLLVLYLPFFLLSIALFLNSISLDFVSFCPFLSTI